MKKFKYESPGEKLFKYEIKSILLRVSLVFNVLLIIGILCIIFLKNNEMRKDRIHYEYTYEIQKLITAEYKSQLKKARAKINFFYQ